ncbi:hypothetical protein D3C79_978600 [compost metagenome]
MSQPTASEQRIALSGARRSSTLTSSSAAPSTSRGSQGAGPSSPSRFASLSLTASAPAPPTQMIPSNQPSPPSRRPGQTRASSEPM